MLLGWRGECAEIHLILMTQKNPEEILYIRAARSIAKKAVLPMPEESIRKIRGGDSMIAYQIGGNGFPLILINGFASSMDTWNPPVLAALGERFRVLVFDNRGTGYSTASEKEFSIPLFANDTLSLMDSLGITKAHILGFSMGTAIALELALYRPERVEKLVLVAGTLSGREVQQAGKEVWDRLLDKSGTPEEIANRMFSLIFPPEWLREHPNPWAYCPEVHEIVTEEIAARQIAAFTSWEVSGTDLRKIAAKTLVLTGTRDAIIPPGHSNRLAGRIPGSKFREIPGAGHGLMYQEPDRFSQMVREFLA